jgi:hypothetical protein
LRGTGLVSNPALPLGEGAGRGWLAPCRPTAGATALQPPRRGANKAGEGGRARANKARRTVVFSTGEPSTPTTIILWPSTETWNTAKPPGGGQRARAAGHGRSGRRACCDQPARGRRTACAVRGALSSNAAQRADAPIRARAVNPGCEPLRGGAASARAPELIMRMRVWGLSHVPGVACGRQGRAGTRAEVGGCLAGDLEMPAGQGSCQLVW